MKLFLQVGLTGWEKNGIGNHYLNYAASLSGDMLGTDLDSQADPMIASLVHRLIDQSSKVFLLVIVSDPNLTLGMSQQVFTKLLKDEEKLIHVVLCGDHRTAESMLSPLHPRVIKESDPDRIKKLIEDFSALT